MMDQQRDYSHLTEDQNLHYRFTAYILKAFKNQQIKHWRRLMRDARMSVPLDDASKSDSALSVPFDTMDKLIDEGDSLENVVCHKTLLACITNLSDRDRRIMNLRIIHNMPHADIAKRLGVQTKTVEKAFERLLKKMRTSLEGS